MDPIAQQDQTMGTQGYSYNPVTFVLQLLASYGWILVGSFTVAACILHKMRPTLDHWREAREDAEYHKDPDTALARMEAIQRAREKQQRLLLEASERAKEQQLEREEQLKQRKIEMLEKYGAATGGQRLGTGDDDYLPLSGGASTSTYRPPKKSKCGGGGCGK